MRHLKFTFVSTVVFICMLTTQSFVFSQTELKNKIVDFSTLLPLENASIYVKNTTIGTVSNSDGKFVLLVPESFKKDTLIISSIGYTTFKTTIEEFDSSMDIFLDPEIAALDEVLLVAEKRPETGNEIVLKALKELPDNLPNTPYLQKGFLRHKERNRNEFKWLIESAITVYDDSTYINGTTDNLRINVDEVRKSYDLRDVDSILSYYSYLKNNAKGVKLTTKKLRRDTILTSSLINAIKWNDTRVNGLQNLFAGKLNLLRNSKLSKALFGEDILNKHQFDLDTILVDNERKLYKIKISGSEDMVGLDTEGIYNEGYQARGWIYIYWDNFAVKKIEYELVAASNAQKIRSKTLFGTDVNHKLVISYLEFEGKMYPNYVYYETPKLVNAGKPEDDDIKDKTKIDYGERYYNTVQEILFSEIILDEELINASLNKTWDPDIFSPKPYNNAFWKNYNVILESEEDEKLIKDLTRKARLFKQ